MVDEKQHLRSFGAVVCIADPAVALEAPAIIFDIEGHQLVGSAATMNLPYSIFHSSRCRHYHTAARSFIGFLAGKGYPLAVHSIASDKLKYLCILFAS